MKRLQIYEFCKGQCCEVCGIIWYKQVASLFSLTPKSKETSTMILQVHKHLYLSSVLSWTEICTVSCDCSYFLFRSFIAMVFDFPSCYTHVQLIFSFSFPVYLQPTNSVVHICMYLQVCIILHYHSLFAPGVFYKVQYFKGIKSQG